MKPFTRKPLRTFAIFAALPIAFAASAVAQNACVSGEEVKKVIATISVPSEGPDFKKVRKELIEMRDERAKLNEKIGVDIEKNQDLITASNQLSIKHLQRVCQILRENGWPSRVVLKDDGFGAFTSIIVNSKAIGMQRELLPILAEAAKKDQFSSAMIATLVDNVRVGFGLPQIFGTQATIKANVITIYPLLDEERVDAWRKEYKLPPLSQQIKRLEGQYLLPVLKSQKRSLPQNAANKPNAQNSDAADLGLTVDENEAVKVETKLVNLNVRILTQDSKVPAGLNLSKGDFQIAEDGVEQEVTFFATTDEPFDLVLLLDFSGSTVDKRGLIKKAAQRFVEYARPKDRIGIVAFATEIKVISPLTIDKAVLSEAVQNIKLEGSSPIWDSLKFTYEKILKKESVGRRSAIVFMTDAVDNSRDTTFTDAMEMVRRGDTTIFSIYLNTGTPSFDYFERVARRSQDFLSMLAAESGGQFYKAKGINDLNGIYERVVNDLGKVYSVGYEPKNERRDGTWRELSVRIKSQPNLIAVTRRGYYAN
jgi:VWFA-related protein